MQPCTYQVFQTLVKCSLTLSSGTVHLSRADCNVLYCRETGHEDSTERQGLDSNTAVMYYTVVSEHFRTSTVRPGRWTHRFWTVVDASNQRWYKTRAVT